MTKPFDFVGHRKVFVSISLGILLIGIFFNVLFGVELGTEFKGGTLLRYSFENELDHDAVERVIEEKLPGFVGDDFRKRSVHQHHFGGTLP